MEIRQSQQSNKTNKIQHMFKELKKYISTDNQKSAFPRLQHLDSLCDASIALAMIKRAPVLRLTACGNSWAEGYAVGRRRAEGPRSVPTRACKLASGSDCTVPMGTMPQSCLCISTGEIYVSLCGNIHNLPHGK